MMKVHFLNTKSGNGRKNSIRVIAVDHVEMFSLG